MNMNIQLTTKYDANGNRVLTVKCGSARAFSLQVNGNLPITKGCDNNILANDAYNRARVISEVKGYVSQYGTPTQKALFA